MRLRFFVALAMAVVLAGGVGFTQGQARVEHFTISEGPFDELMVKCGDFDVYEQYSVTFRGTRRYDQSGTLVQIVGRLSAYDAIYYNATAPEKFIEATGEHALRRWDISDGVPYNGMLFMSGPGVRLKLPKRPVVFLHTGHWIFDTTPYWTLLFQKGRSDLFDNDVEALCNALR